MVAGSIPDGVIKNFLFKYYISLPNGPKFNSDPERNEHQEYFLEGKGG